MDTGTTRTTAGKHVGGYGPILLYKPSNVIFHQQTKSYIISDFCNHRIVQCYTNRQQRLRTLLEKIKCIGLATDTDGNLYISDVENHEVRRYQLGTTHSIVVAGGNGQGTRLNQLNHPTCICVGNDHSVYVSDTGNGRVVRWKTYANRGMIVAGGHGKGKHRTQLNCPAGLIIDQLGTIYVADYGNNRIMRWRKNAEPDVIAGNFFSSGDNAEQLLCPEGITFDDAGNLYVADSHNNRIQQFRICTQ